MLLFTLYHHYFLLHCCNRQLADCNCLDTRDMERACIMTGTRNIPCDGRGGHKQTLNVYVNIPLLDVLNHRPSYSQQLL